MSVEIQKIQDEAVAGISAARDERALEDARVAYLGKKGTMAAASAGMRDVPNEEKPAFGAALNAARKAISDALESKTSELQDLADKKSVEGIDVTLPARELAQGGYIR